MTPIEIRSRMNATGIGLAGLEGVWWLPASQPFVLPHESRKRLQRISWAVFALLDVVREMYGTDEGEVCGLNRLLNHKVPLHLRRLASKQPVLAVRPDFQIVQFSPWPRRPQEGYKFVATELEICPSAQGFAHAMQLGYELELDLLRAAMQRLNGRELLIVCTQAWSEFIWDQLAFCKAIVEAGGRARLLLDIPIEKLAEQVRQKQRWVPPMFGIPNMPEQWNDDVLSRINTIGVPVSTISDAHNVVPGDSVFFRFGYLDCFDDTVLQQLDDWERQGATFLNPTSFVWDSKVVMAALNLPMARVRVGQQAAAMLDACIPKTYLLTEDLLTQLQRERSEWVLKFAGFDSGQQAWGGRSLQWGILHNNDSWEWTLRQYLDLPFPVVAQRRTMSESHSVQYFDQSNRLCWNSNISDVGANMRLRSFLVRHGNAAQACGTHITFARGISVSEGVKSIQAPVVML
jgi:hypothetical protein